MNSPSSVVNQYNKRYRLLQQQQALNPTALQSQYSAKKMRRRREHFWATDLGLVNADNEWVFWLVVALAVAGGVGAWCFLAGPCKKAAPMAMGGPMGYGAAALV